MPIQLAATNRLHHRPPCSLNNEYWLSVYQITTMNSYCRQKCQNMRKNMRYAHFAKICEKCSKVPDMRQSHIRVFLTCLTSFPNPLWVPWHLFPYPCEPHNILSTPTVFLTIPICVQVSTTNYDKLPRFKNQAACWTVFDNKTDKSMVDGHQ